MVFGNNDKLRIYVFYPARGQAFQDNFHPDYWTGAGVPSVSISLSAAAA